MKADAMPLLALFESKSRHEVPLFQRQYVWSKEQQWEPLWEDISRKFTEYLEARKDAPVHFLGAMVLDQLMTPAGHVDKRQVIDGQQRMTTLQIFLAAFRDFCFSQDCEELGKECQGYTQNTGMMNDRSTEKYKVWPTASDRAVFQDVLDSGSRKELEARHPLVTQYRRRIPDPRPRMVEAYYFFYDQLVEFFLGNSVETPQFAEVPIADRLEECFQALRKALQVVVVNLDAGDDAQVIFETLNARGEPLLPADLLRNYIFLRAARGNENQEQLYETYWAKFDDSFWRHEVLQGRLSRPRSDLFMQHYLASKEGREIPIKHLFVEYKHWIHKHQPFPNVEAELQNLSSQRDNFRRLIAPKKSDPLYEVSKFLTTFEVSTVYPLILWFLEREREEEEIRQLGRLIESYLVRRAVCNLTTKNYNRLFLRVITALQKGDLASVSEIESYLKSLTGDSSEWPTDANFSNAWLSSHAYRFLGNPRLVHILRRVGDTFHTTKMEELEILSSLSVEHIMPQSWVAHWPLLDGETGYESYELWSKDDSDPVAAASRARHQAVQTFGNLTIVTQPLNSAASNASWLQKRAALLQSSLLPINQVLHTYDTWDEQSVAHRGKDLLERALKIWPR